MLCIYYVLSLQILSFCISDVSLKQRKKNRAENAVNLWLASAKEREGSLQRSLKMFTEESWHGFRAFYKLEAVGNVSMEKLKVLLCKKFR